mgnify:CR=1 FL=1
MYAVMQTKVTLVRLWIEEEKTDGLTEKQIREKISPWRLRRGRGRRHGGGAEISASDLS